jgi:NAD(P)-dependent dehydrogenase (short-subunit alcohol dehydrogenase family)
MAGRFQGKVAIVTGASSGIGRATAQIFARDGAMVVVVANKNVAGGEETVGLIKKAGGEATFIQADVSKATEVEAMVKKTVKLYGGLDCASNNAGVMAECTGSLTDLTEAQWDHIINNNLKSIWLCMKYEIPEMIKRGRGAIVNTSSLAALKAIGIDPFYTASKHGVIGLTKSAAIDFGKKGIRVNAVCPGLVLTPRVRSMGVSELNNAEIKMIPMGRTGEPEEIGAAVAWMCSDEASFVNGHVMVVDGGTTA